MCTIVALRGVRPDLPLVLATNRDEYFARPSTGAVRLLEHPPTVGGRDLLAGGTWMGVTQGGLFVGVTNQRGGGREAGRKSRGSLVLSALALADADEIARWLCTLDGREYNAFNLLWGDTRSLRAAYGREDAREIEQEEVPPGVHVLPNDRLDSPSFVKVARAKALIEPLLALDQAALLEGLKAVLADRELPAIEDIPALPPESQLSRELLQQLAALCVRTPSYGTRSSTVVSLAPGAVHRYWVADGPPDSTPFVDVTPLF